MMLKNNLRLIIFCLILLIVQFLINNLTIFYVDLFGIILVLLLLIGNKSWSKLIFISIAADLFGHWYLGCHLFGIVILSLFSTNFISFYKICNSFQKIFIANIFFILLNLIIYAIDFVIDKRFNSLSSILVEVMIFLPLIQLTLDKLVNKSPSEFIFYD